jgi:flagellar biosynthesis protein FliR
MGTDLTIDVGTLYAFLLVLARISGAFIFVPIPGIQAGPQIARVLLSVSLTLALQPRWPAIDAAGVRFPLLIGWILAEAGMGLAVGLAVAILTEGFQMGAQIISLQAGYTFASTIDPSSGADSTVLIMISQTAAGLLFFATGLDRQILRAFADSLTAHPPGHFAITLPMATRMIQASSAIFTTGLRLVLPLLALLLMVEISLALLTRLNSQLQLMQISFPIKMLLSLTLFGWLLLIFPQVFAQSASRAMQLVYSLLAA